MSDPSRAITARFARAPRVNYVFQLVAKLGNRFGRDTAAAYKQAQRLTVAWMQQRCPRAFPEGAAIGEPFDIELPGQRFAATGIPDLWAARLEHPDNKIGGRTWSVEVTLSAKNAIVQFGIRMFCSSIGESGPIERTKPKIVGDVVREIGLTEVRQINGRPWSLQSESDLGVFESVLLDPERQLPVILLTEVDPARIPFRVPRYLLDPDALAQRTLGVAYVVTMPSGLGFRWTDNVGKEWSAFQGAVRTYRAGLSFEQDDPHKHPLTLPERIVCWTEDGGWEKAYTDFLVQQAFVQSVLGSNWRKQCLTFSEVRAKSLELARNEAKSDLELRQLYEAEIANIKQEMKGLEEYVTYCDSELEKYRQEIESQKRRAFDVRQENDRLRAFVSATGRDADSEIVIPDELDDLQEWVQRNLSGRLSLHPRAVRAAKKSPYEDVPLVYRSLLLLADEYREMRLNRLQKEDFEARLTEMGLEFERSITRERAGEQGDTYFVEYPAGSGRKAFLEYHLRKGTTKDDRYSLRIYFFWDAEEQQVVVGSLPGHLETRAS